MLPHARVTPVRKPMGMTLVSHDLKVMSLCFSSEMNPVCTNTTEVIQPKSTPRDAREMGKWKGVTARMCLLSRMMLDAAVRYPTP